MKRICSVYQSSKKAGMYLYVLRADALKKVP
ncbi:MAG: YcgL domain-containing protein, partial [Gammaproteobacteria bacterium]|nr:YcgL domain-containing protein [Gammaproteobacteria bacterium]